MSKTLSCDNDARPGALRDPAAAGLWRAEAALVAGWEISVTGYWEKQLGLTFGPRPAEVLATSMVAARRQREVMRRLRAEAGR